MSFLCLVLAFCCSSSVFSLLIFFFLFLFSSEKVAKKHPNLVLVDSSTPPSTPKVAPSSPLCFPPTIWSVLPLISPVLYFNPESKIWTYFFALKSVSLLHLHQGTSFSPNMAPSSYCYSSLVPQCLTMFSPCFVCPHHRFSHILR